MGTQPQSKSVEVEPQVSGGSEASPVGRTSATGTPGAMPEASPEERVGTHGDPPADPEAPAAPARAAPVSPPGTNGASGNGSATEARPTDEAPPGTAPEVELIEAEELSTTTTRRKRRLTSWVGLGAKKVVSKIYATSADDLEERARRAVGSAYRDQADDLEERAVRAMRQAILSEADKIKEAVEHGVEIKRREVRLSLVVLVTASLVYLALYWFTRSGPAG